jgi:hypothetical protein
MATKTIYFIPSSLSCCWLRDPGWKNIRIREKHPETVTLHGTFYKIFRPPNPLLKVPDLVLPFKCQDPYGHGICEVFCSNMKKSTKSPA